MNKRIIFLTTAHNCFDDRIFYHQAISLSEAGNIVKIVSLSTDFIGFEQGVEIESYNIIQSQTKSQRIHQFISILKAFSPDIIICSEPLAVVAAARYKVQNKLCKVVYDITEWYPSKKQLSKIYFPLNLVKFTTLALYNLYAGLKCDAFIFGENYKKLPFSILFPFKKSLLLPYFPDERYIHFKPKEFNPRDVTFCYTGRISEEKGIGNFYRAINSFTSRNKLVTARIKIIGSCQTEADELYFKNLQAQFNLPHTTIISTTEFTEFTKELQDVDLCFDLRTVDFENTHCLPIKLFYYMACGKPVVYSKLKAIKNFVEIDKFGALVSPSSADEIANVLECYMLNSEFYNTIATNARRYYQQKYNWTCLQSQFHNFLQIL